LPALAGLSYLWETSDFYGHAYAMPVVAGVLAWRDRARLGAALRPLRPPALGWLVALAAAAFQTLFAVGQVGFGGGLGIPLVLGAAAWAVGGRALLRPLLLPLAFLALAVPPPRFLTYAILFRLKLLVTQTAVALLQAAGLTVVAEGNQILLPGATLFVADACSGLTSIVTLLPLACAVAWFLGRGIWRRALIVASVVPLALAANALRVVVTVLLVSGHGIEYAQGLLHDSFGLLTSLLGTLATIAVARVLR
jgi:exosortase